MEHVYGRLAKLFRVKDVQKYGLAIQTIAGARLRHVVVASATVAREILAQHACKTRESFIPIAEVKFPSLANEQVAKIKQMAQGEVELALNLLEYDPKYHKAIASIFGSTFVSELNSSARHVSMENPNQKLRYNCVTLDGTMYKSDGVLSGGSQRQSSQMEQIEKLLAIDLEIRNAKANLSNLKVEVSKLTQGL